MADIAARVWAHRWKIDPIVRSLIDTDFYKLLKCQSVRRKFADARVTFSLINRAPEVRLAELIDEEPVDEVDEDEEDDDDDDDDSAWFADVQY